MKTSNRKPKIVKFFTDEDHKNIFVFQEGMCSRGYGGSKPVIKSLTVRTSSRGKTRVR